jgi:hypothetical protein
VKITRFVALICLATVVTAVGVGSGGIAVAVAPNWAPADVASVHPGVQTVSESGQCTSNFIFYDGTDIYIGQAAHCTGIGGNTETNGCESGVLPLGTPVMVGGAAAPGTVVYNSWITMQDVNEGDLNTCLGNDFALVRLDPIDHGKVNPSVPFWGGPTASTPGTSAGEDVYSYGNSSLRFGATQLSPKTGVIAGQQFGGWNHVVYTASPGIPGDSGSAYMSSNGGALGVLSTIQVAPLAGSNGVSDLGRALAYMRAFTNLDAVQLANGTEQFTALL